VNALATSRRAPRGHPRAIDVMMDRDRLTERSTDNSFQQRGMVIAAELGFVGLVRGAGRAGAGSHD